MCLILSIGITSYKRVNELERCLNSICTRYVDKIEIVVSEDKSPLSDDIAKKVNEIALNSRYNIRFTSNEKNLGYDMNLGALIKKCKGKYIFFMSDDDMLTEGCLDEVIEFLSQDLKYGVLYAPFIYFSTKKKDRNRGASFSIVPGEKSAARYIYDSILFSGLIFRKDYVEGFNAERFKNYNYFQVYLFLQMLYHHGGYFFSTPSVVCVGDGENAYGISGSSGGNAILADRKSVKSNLEFNKTLFKTIKMFDQDEKTHIMDSFAKQYSLHSYSGLSIARAEGVKYYNEYWKILKALDIKIYPIAYCYYFILRVLGKKNSDYFMRVFRKLVKRGE